MNEEKEFLVETRHGWTLDEPVKLIVKAGNAQLALIAAFKHFRPRDGRNVQFMPSTQNPMLLYGFIQEEGSIYNSIALQAIDLRHIPRLPLG